MNLNKNIKAFFIDLDGTLLDTKRDGAHAISVDNLAALKVAKEHGIHTIISTGRSGLQAKRYLDMIDYDYAVTGNGSLILKGEKVIKDITMSLRQSLLITDYVKQHGLVMKIDDSRIGYGAFKWLPAKLTAKMGFQPVKHFNFEMHKEYHKIVVWGKSKTKMAKFADILRENIKDLSLVTSGNGWTLEISHKDATKGLGNAYIGELLGIKKKEEMAHIGDSMNDSTVVGKMRLIAMKNSDKNLLKLTKFVGPSYKNGGVAKVLRGEYKKLEK